MNVLEYCMTLKDSKPKLTNNTTFNYYGTHLQKHGIHIGNHRDIKVGDITLEEVGMGKHETHIMDVLGLPLEMTVALKGFGGVEHLAHFTVV